MKITELCEILMLISFGFSWPFNAIKSYKARTAKGKSIQFLILILFGYVCGIISKLTAASFKWYVMFFYILNFCRKLEYNVCIHGMGIFLTRHHIFI